MSAIWLTMIGVGVLTFLTRLSFIALLERWRTPPLVQRALRFVPVSVLTAIFVPDLLIQDQTLNVSLTNERLIAGMIAILVAWRTKNVVWTILAGMIAFWVVKIWF
jgi:branched-subunit amino acid transport protein